MNMQLVQPLPGCPSPHPVSPIWDTLSPFRPSDRVCSPRVPTTPRSEPPDRRARHRPPPPRLSRHHRPAAAHSRIVGVDGQYSHRRRRTRVEARGPGSGPPGQAVRLTAVSKSGHCAGLSGGNFGRGCGRRERETGNVAGNVEDSRRQSSFSCH